MDVMRQVMLKAHLRPMVSVRMPNTRAPTLRSGMLVVDLGEEIGCAHASPALPHVNMRPCLSPGTPISWLGDSQRLRVKIVALFVNELLQRLTRWLWP